MKKITILIFAFACVASVYSQTPAELNTLIQQSFTYFPRIKELNKNTELAEMRVDLSKTNYLPTVNGIGSYSYISPISVSNFASGPSPSDVKTLQFQPNNNLNFNVGLNQVLWDFGKTQAQIEKAKADLLTSRLNTESAKLQVATQVASIYYALTYLKRGVQVEDSVIAYFVENKKIIEGKIKNGDALHIDLTTIDINIDQEKNRKVEFLRLYDRQMALMRFTTGQSFVPTTAEFNFPDLMDSTSFERNPEVLAANERIASANADLKLAGANKIPTLSLQAGAGFKNGYQPDIFETRFNYLAGVTLNVPIFQGGRLEKNTVVAKKSMELTELSKSTLYATLQKDIESVKADIKAYAEQIKNSETQIIQARENSLITDVRYKQGVVTYLDLIYASSNLQRAFINKLQAEYQRILAEIELARLLGIKFWQE